MVDKNDILRMLRRKHHFKVVDFKRKTIRSFLFYLSKLLIFKAERKTFDFYAWDNCQNHF